MAVLGDKKKRCWQRQIPRMTSCGKLVSCLLTPKGMTMSQDTRFASWENREERHDWMSEVMAHVLSRLKREGLAASSDRGDIHEDNGSYSMSLRVAVPITDYDSPVELVFNLEMDNEYPPRVKSAEVSVMSGGYGDRYRAQATDHAKGMAKALVKAAQKGLGRSGLRSANVSENLKDQLVRLGAERPDLRKDIRPILASLEVQAATSPWATEAGRFGKVPLGEAYKKGQVWVAEIQWPVGRVDRATFTDSQPQNWEWMGVHSAHEAAKQWVLNYRKSNPKMHFGAGFEKDRLPGPFGKTSPRQSSRGLG